MGAPQGAVECHPVGEHRTQLMRGVAMLHPFVQRRKLTRTNVQSMVDAPHYHVHLLRARGCRTSTLQVLRVQARCASLHNQSTVRMVEGVPARYDCTADRS